MTKPPDWKTALRRGLICTLAVGCSWIASIPGNLNAGEYLDAEALGKRLRALSRSHRRLLRVRSEAQSLGKKDVWLAELGRGEAEDRKTRPAMLVVAGIEGNDLTGCAVAVAWIERLVDQYEKNEQIRKILDTTTIYVFPRLNPDAAESFFAKPAIERSVTSKPVDDDHDGMTDEDGPEDLNGDGWITWMRIEDPEGEYILDPSEPRLLMKADAIKGEVAGWRLLTEGRDNDGDEEWNEDGPGGVNLNRNFPYQYKWFAADAGIHQVSEVETRALADFIVEHRSIGIVFTFGAADNLAKTPKGEPKPSGGKPATAIDENDLSYHKQIAEAYRTTLGLKKELEVVSHPGTFSDWMYFHRGRLSLAARPWTPAIQLELERAKNEEDENKKDDAKSEDAEIAEDESTSPSTKREDKSEEDERNKEDRAFLKWIDENAPETFVPWKEYNHPDFPGKRVALGGFAPFAKTTPPKQTLDEIASKHADFLTTLALRLPRIGIRKMERKHLGESVYEVKIQIENTGYLPTVLTHGERTREVHPTRVTLDLDGKAFLSGTKTTQVSTIPGSGGMEEIRYILHVPDRKQFKVRVVSMLGGTVEKTLKLDGEKKQ